MNVFELNGYIDDSVWWGDEVTPDMLREALNTAKGADMLIRINSFGGSCNAATRMYDMIKAYPGNIHTQISGAACSAASVLSMAGKTVEMTPGSLFMYHNPSTIAWGEERDLMGAIDVLRAVKESIINIYTRKVNKTHDALAAEMDATTWLDAEAALAAGFIDRITGDGESGGPTNRIGAHNTIDQHDAEAKVRAWAERRMPPPRAKATAPTKPEPEPTEPQPEANEPPAPQGQGVFVANKMRLLLLEV